MQSSGSRPSESARYSDRQPLRIRCSARALPRLLREQPGRRIWNRPRLWNPRTSAHRGIALRTCAFARPAGLRLALPVPERRILLSEDLRELLLLASSLNHLWPVTYLGICRGRILTSYCPCGQPAFTNCLPCFPISAAPDESGD